MSSSCPVSFGLDSGALARLGLEEGLRSRSHVAESCQEIARILRCCYDKSSKQVQAKIFDLAFSAVTNPLLSEAKSIDEAVRKVAQAADSALPSQKKAVIRREYRQASVQRKRKPGQKEHQLDTPFLPEGVVANILRFLDLPALLRCSAVCKLWRDVVYHDKHLWRPHASMILPLICPPNAAAAAGLQEGVDGKDFFSFCSVYAQRGCKKLICNRAVCSRCHSIVWLDQMTPPTSDFKSGLGRSASSLSGKNPVRGKDKLCRHQWRLVDSSEVIFSMASNVRVDTDSDDSDTEADASLPFFRLWAAPKIAT